MRLKTTFLIAAATGGVLAGAAFAQGAQPQTIGVAKAVAAAEAATGGRAFEADLDMERGAPVYEIDLVRNGRTVEAHVDGVSGKVLRQTEPAKLRLPFGREDLTAAQTAPRSLTETITMVEAATKGRVTDIGLEREGGRHYYEVELAGAQDREVRVDLRTGAIAPVIDD
ncbi:PepSY domain-containing protein [Phenylobacterium sp.]|uniref:PepSY domain-containing protein n=1 Tax=Phenylobacterium sp. TaxID=1871053 RepID=UPI0035B38402